MIEIAIVEDEKSFADQLTGYLDRYEEEEGEKGMKGRKRENE